MLWQGREKHWVALISRQVLFLTDLEKSRFCTVVRAPDSGGTHISEGIDFNTGGLSIEWMPFSSLSFDLGFYHSPSLSSLLLPSVVFFFFCSVEFSQSFLLPGDSDLEKQCLFLFLFRNSRLLPLCCNANLCLSRKKTAQWQMNWLSHSEASRGPIYVWMA